MKRLFILSLLLLCVWNFNFAQSNKIDSLRQQHNFHSQVELLFFCRPEVADVPIPTEGWQTSIIETTTGELFQIPAIYNVHKNEVQLSLNEKLYILFPEKVRHVLLGDSLFVVRQFKGPHHLISNYFQMLAGGALQLLLLHKSDSPGSGILYVQDKNGVIGKFKSTKKNLFKFMAGHKAQVEAYISQHGLDLKKVSDLSKVFQYYNQLEAQ